MTIWTLTAVVTQSVSQLDSSSIVVAVIAVVGTLGASYMMLRGKTQETANWLVTALKKEVEDAKKASMDCEAHRIEDRKTMDDLRAMIGGLQSGVRTLRSENESLRRKMSRLEDRMTAELDLTHGQRSGGGHVGDDSPSSTNDGTS